MTTMDRSRRTESGRQPAIRSSAPWRHGRTATRQVRPHRAQPASDTGSVATDGRPSQRPSRLVDQSVERGHSRNPTTPGQIAADTWPAGLPRPPPASPAPGLTEPTAERLAERADAADTGRLDTRRLDTGRLDHGRRPPGRLDRGRLDRRADAKQWARAGAGRRTGVLAFPTSATTLPISDRRPRIRRGRRRLRRSATRTAWR